MTEDSKIAKIRAQDVSYAAEIRSLSLFLRFKLDVIEGRKEALGKSVVCALNVKEPHPTEWKVISSYSIDLM